MMKTQGSLAIIDGGTVTGDWGALWKELGSNGWTGKGPSVPRSNKRVDLHQGSRQLPGRGSNQSVIGESG